MKTTERALRDLVLKDEICELQHTYGLLCDENYDAEGLAELFVEQGVWERFPGKGAAPTAFIGRDAIKENFASAREVFPWGMHISIPLRIAIAEDGRSATGLWNMMMPAIAADRGERFAVWIAGRYENDLVTDQDGRWRFSHVRMKYELRAPHAGDWSVSRIVDLGFLSATPHS